MRLIFNLNRSISWRANILILFSKSRLAGQTRGPNDEFSGALAVDGTRVVGKRVRWNEQLGWFPFLRSDAICKLSNCIQLVFCEVED